MRISITLFLWFYTFINTFGQFEFIHSSKDHNSSPLVIELENETIIIVNQQVHQITKKTSSQIVTLSSDGSISSEISYPYFITDMQKMAENKILILAIDTAEITEGGNGTKLLSFIYNNNLEILNRDTLTIRSSMINNFKVEENLHFYCLSIVNLPFDFEIYIGKFDNNGKFTDTCSFIHDNLFPISNFFYSPDSVLNFFINYRGILTLDLITHNFVLKNFSNAAFDAGYDMFWKNDNSIVIGGSVDRRNIGDTHSNRQFMIVEANLNFQITESTILQQPYMINLSGINKCLAWHEDFFYYTGTKNSSPQENDTTFIYVAKLTSDRQLIWEKSIPWLSGCRVFSISSAKNGGCIVGVCVKNPETGLWDLCVLKFDTYGNYSAINIEPQIEEIKTYPNPTSNTLQFELPPFCNHLFVEFYDVKGNKTESTYIESNRTILDVSQWDCGIYFYKVISNQRPIYSGSFIKNAP